MLISVVIPTFRRIPLVLRAIESARRQIYPKLEILVIDNEGNSDLEQQIGALNDQRVIYDRFVVRSGGAAARNRGISLATGDAIAFLDDDDAWLPEKLQKQIPLLSEAEVVVCGYITELTGVRRIERGAVVDLRLLRRGNPFPTSGFVIRADVMQQLLFDEELPNGQDWELLIRLAIRKPLVNLREALFVYNDGDHDRISNAVIQSSPSQMQARLRAIEKHALILGEYWTRFRTSQELLAYIGRRRDKFTLIAEVRQRCGTVPMIHDLGSRLGKKILRQVLNSG